MPFLRAAKIWVLVSAFATLAGLTLSVAGQLNRAGYAAAVTILLLAWWKLPRKQPVGDTFKRPSWSKLRRRFARPLPALFALLAVLIFLGGVLYSPSNYDALTYRLPRVLHWLAAEHWHWIDTPNYRMNNRGWGFEWLSAPLLLFTRSDRALFLLNFIPYLLLPGLTFAALTGLGVGRRVAWHWMWLLPAGLNFALQAGSMANDAFAAPYALAAIAFGLRAAKNRSFSDFAVSTLAAALLTGSKSGYLPLLLPWLLVVRPALSGLRCRLAATILLGAVALAVSVLPISLINLRYCGDWTGLNLEVSGINARSPLAGVVGNSMMTVIGNLVPPVFPFAGWWNEHVFQLMPVPLAAWLQANMENGFARLLELPSEETAGLGLGVSLLLACAASATLWSWRRGWRPTRRQGLLWCAPFVALLMLFAKTGMQTIVRVIAPFYPLLLPLLLSGPYGERLTRSRWWRFAAGVTILLAMFAVVMTPARPLWPAQRVFAPLQQSYPDQRLFTRAAQVYAVYAARPDLYAAARADLPVDARVIGFLGGNDDTPVSLWKPFGLRRVVAVTAADDLARLQARGVCWLLVKEFTLRSQGIDPDVWQAERSAELVRTLTMTAKVAEGAQRWRLLRLPSAGGLP